MQYIRKLLASQVLRFLIAGSFNTLVTLMLFWQLRPVFAIYVDRVIAYQLANSIAYIAGILLSYLLNTQFVFRTSMSLRTFLQFPGVYVVQFLLSAALLGLLIELLRVPPDVAPVISVIVLLPVTFLLSKYVLRVPQHAAHATSDSH